MAYIHQILACFGMFKCTLISTLFIAKQVLFASQLLKNKNECLEYTKFMNSLKYFEVIGTLLYATQTWLNIQYSVQIIFQFSDNPRKTYLEAVERIPHYSRGTAHLALVFRRSKSNKINLVGWTDSN